MRKARIPRAGALKSVDLEFVFQSYVIGCVISTSGLDVLLLLTLFFILLTSIRHLSGLGHHETVSLLAHLEHLAGADAEAQPQGLGNRHLALFGNDRFHTDRV